MEGLGRKGWPLDNPLGRKAKQLGRKMKEIRKYMDERLGPANGRMDMEIMLRSTVWQGNAMAGWHTEKRWSKRGRKRGNEMGKKDGWTGKKDGAKDAKRK